YCSNRAPPRKFPATKFASPQRPESSARSPPPRYRLPGPQKVFPILRLNQRGEPEISNLRDRPKTSSPPPRPPRPQYRRDNRYETRQTNFVSRPASETIVRQCAKPLQLQSNRHPNKKRAIKSCTEIIQLFPAPVRLPPDLWSPGTTNVRSVPSARELPDRSADDCARE